MRIIKWWDPERKQAFYANVEQWLWNKKSALTISEWSLNGLTSVSHSLCCKIWVNSSKIWVPIWLITDNADSLYIFNWSLLSDTHIVKLVQKYWYSASNLINIAHYPKWLRLTAKCPVLKINNHATGGLRTLDILGGPKSLETKKLGSWKGWEDQSAEKTNNWKDKKYLTNRWDTEKLNISLKRD